MMMGIMATIRSEGCLRRDTPRLFVHANWTMNKRQRQTDKCRLQHSMLHLNQNTSCMRAWQQNHRSCGALLTTTGSAQETDHRVKPNAHKLPGTACDCADSQKKQIANVALINGPNIQALTQSLAASAHTSRTD